MIENLREMDVELFDKKGNWIFPPKDWLDAQTQQTRDALVDLEAAATALASINADIEAGQARIMECADVLRAAQDYERAHGGPMTQTELAKSFIASQQAR